MNLGVLTYYIKAKNSEFKQKIDESKQKIASFDDRIKKSQQTLQRWSDTAKKVSLGVSAALAAVTLELRKATQENVRYTNALIGLQSIAESLGEDLDAVTEAAKNLASDGLMGIDDAATSLKNLLQAGFGLEESIILIERFKDSAAFGRQGALSFGEAIRSATEGIKNGNSILVDNAGVTKNLSVMLQEAGYSAQDLMRAADDAGVRMAIFNGILRETQHQVGDAAKLANELGGSLSRTEESARRLHRAIGEAVEDRLKRYLDSIDGIINRTADWIERNKELTDTLITGLTGVLGALLGLSTGVIVLEKIVGALVSIKNVLPYIKAGFVPFTVGGAVIVGLTILLVKLREIRNEILGLGRDLSVMDLADVDRELARINEELEKRRQVYEAYRAGNLGAFPQLTVTMAKEYEEFLKERERLEKRREEILKAQEELEGLEIPDDALAVPEIVPDSEQIEKILNEYRNKMDLLHREALDRRLREIELEYAQEAERLEKLGATEEEIAEVRKYYARLWMKAVEENRREEYALEVAYQNQIKLLHLEGLEYELELLRQEEKAAIEAAEGKERAIAVIQEYYRQRREQIEEEYRQRELEAERKAEKERHKQRLEEIKRIREERQAAIDAAIQEWLEEEQKATERFEQDYLRTMLSAYDYEKEMLDRQYKYYRTYVQDKNAVDEWYYARLAELQEKYAEEEGQRLNWLTSYLVKLGYSVEEVNAKFKTWKDTLVQGLSEAIVKGKDFLNVLEDIAYQIAVTIAQKGLVEPFVNFLFTALPMAHTGALVTTAGLVQDLPAYHSGGRVPGLAGREQIVKVLAGERILSPAQNRAFEAGLFRPEVNIEVVNNTGTPIQTRREVQVDGKRTVIRLFMEGYAQNIEGIQDILRR